MLEAIGSGVFSPDDRGRYRDLVDALRGSDYFMVAADFDAYYDCQREVDARWSSSPDWQQAAILNTANMGWFSSDRTIREYAEDIWNVPVR